jgi:hypothetical protein
MRGRPALFTGSVRLESALAATEIMDLNVAGMG